MTSSSTDDLCPALFDKLRGTSWKLGELRPEPKTLERVFRELAQQAGEDVVADAAPARAQEVSP